jgi:alanine racemase
MHNQLAPLNVIRLRRDNLYHNLQIFQELASGQKIIPVLKSNAYGHGIREVAAMLNGMVEMVAVDGYFEALQILPVFKGRVLVLGYILPENYPILKRKRLEFVIQTVGDLQALARTNKTFQVHMEINSGMNRMGLRPVEVGEYLDFLQQHPKLHLNGVMTHLFDADSADNKTTDDQLAVFDQVVDQVVQRGFQPEFLHSAATAGAARRPSKHANAARVGLGLYGANPFAPDNVTAAKLAGLQRVITFRTQVVQVNQLQPGERVGYNGIWWAKSPSKIAVVPVGYYEGVPRDLSDRGYLLFGGQKVPIVGRVCMNHTMIDATEFSDLERGSEVLVPVHAWAADFNMSVYELLARVSDTIRREVI